MRTDEVHSLVLLGKLIKMLAGCDNATLISALNSEDTGTLNIVNGLFGLPRDIIAAAFGGDETLLDKYDKLLEAIPDIGTGANVGSAECLTRCNILP